MALNSTMNIRLTEWCPIRARRLYLNILSISDVCAAGEDLRDVGSDSTNIKGYVA
jgi:hypothetical protein